MKVCTVFVEMAVLSPQLTLGLPKKGKERHEHEWDTDSI
jgi:hypothetical protein